MHEQKTVLVLHNSIAFFGRFVDDLILVLAKPKICQLLKATFTRDMAFLPSTMHFGTGLECEAIPRSSKNKPFLLHQPVAIQALIHVDMHLPQI